jgi:signal transduction histidine kinase/phage shock protein PspC (stress-responsive transcriptional regulator)
VIPDVREGRRCDDLSMAPVQPQSGRPGHPAPLRRHPDSGLIGGVCVGLAGHFGLDIRLTRLVVAVLVAVGGIGVAVYVLAWALIPVAAESERRVRPPGALRRAALVLVAGGGLLVGVRLSGVRFGEALVWPLVLGACGLALVWRPTVAAADGSDAGRRLSMRALGGRVRRLDVPRLVIGGLLVAFASAAVLHAAGIQHSLGKAFGAVAFVAVVLGLLIGPVVVRLGRSLASERAARIREQERAELAAHLHDSVLQTLALIQKRAGDPREVAGLARRQERELRSWLQEGSARPQRDSVAGALERAAAEVEELHRVPIEVVTVGDGPLNGRLEAVVQAAREAMTNAAKFASSERVDLYAEVAANRVEVFVRDRGVGFDPLAIPTDRRGVRDSIIARMERHQGRAAVHSKPGQGTEIELVMEGV